MRVDVQPELLQWACERSGVDVDAYAARFPILEWVRGDRKPTLKQLESFAKATRTPVGYLFLSEPPEEHVPIPDMRTKRGEGVRQPSPDLLETIHTCQQRQEWYREYVRSLGEATRSFVESADLDVHPAEVAANMRSTLGLEMPPRASGVAAALRTLIRATEDAGVLVMVSGIVGSNTRRTLDPDEFRGFALVDAWAPVIFVNGADSKSAQRFTLAHELAHVWLGSTALSDAEPTALNESGAAESWCNAVAAEFLVPLSQLVDQVALPAEAHAHVEELARHFHVSSLVILRRFLDAGYFTRREFVGAYQAEMSRLRSLSTRPQGGGGNFYLTHPVRVSRRFARALVASALEGQTLHRDALQLLGLSKVKTLHELGRHLEVA